MRSVYSTGWAPRFWLALLLSVLLQPSLFAQQPAPEFPTQPRVHFGPLGISPRISLVNLGVDTNVFNDAGNPRRDFTFTLEPALKVQIDSKAGAVNATGQLDMVYFRTFESERSMNGFSTVQYDRAFNRLKPYASFSALDTRDRPGYEVDTRPRRFENTLRTGTSLRLASKTDLDVIVRRQTISFAGDAVFQGQRLSNVLDRTLVGVEANWRQRITPLTTLVATISEDHDRFRFSNDRDSNNFRFKSGVELGRFALIRGSAYVGFRRLKPATGSTLPPFSGLTADVDVAYTAPSQTRLTLTVLRDVQYSVDDINPYYIQTGWNVGLIQRVIGRWDVRLTGGQEHLSYQRLISVTSVSRLDRVDKLGGGIEYELNQDVSAGFMVESYFRSSNEPGHRYASLRSFGTVTYGF